MADQKRGKKQPTAAQLRARERFREAARHAKAQLLDPERKHYYTMKARKDGLPSAYVAAVTEYLRSTPLVKILGSLKRPLHPFPVKAQAPVVRRTRTSGKSSSKPRRGKGGAQAVAIFMTDAGLGVVCSDNMKIKKIKTKEKPGYSSFSITFR